MKPFALRTHLILAAALLSLLSAGTVFSYWLRSRAHARIEQGFNEDLERLTKLTHLQVGLWRLDAAFSAYILSGEERGLSEYGERRAAIEGLEQEFKAQPGQEKELPLIEGLEKGIAELIAGQERLIRERRAGAAPRMVLAAAAALRAAPAAVIEPILTIRDVNRTELRASQAAEASASRHTFFLLLAMAILASLLLMAVLLRNIIAPLSALERATSAWKLGEPWRAALKPASPELDSLASSVGSMAARLNAQFQSEHRANELKTQLVSLVSHDFNNALAVIRGVATILEDAEATLAPARKKELFQILNSNVRALALECSTVLNLGRMESGRFAIAPRKTLLRSLLKETLARLDILAQRKSLQVSMEIPEIPVYVRADPEALPLVLTNLVSNAIKYTPEGGAVKTGFKPVAKEPASVEVYVEDTGIGIKPEERAKIFSGYYRTESGKELARGFGVGLSLAKSIVEAHGGILDFTSAPKKGSRFFFRLPVWKEDDHA